MSEEHGTSVALAGRWYSQALGGQFNELMLTLDGRAYVNNPLFDNHVLALRVAAALALGPDYREGFILGGAQGSSIFTVQTESVYPLRGFPVNLDKYPAGIGMLAVYAEYRLPLWHIERGLWTAPAYLEHLHLGLFVDAGNTLGRGAARGARAMSERAWARLRGGRVGAGGELRADVSLGWAFPLTLRLGAAWPIVDHGEPVQLHLNDTSTYLTLGTAI